MPFMGCTFATVDSMSTISFDRASTPSSAISIVLDPDGPLTGELRPADYGVKWWTSPSPLFLLTSRGRHTARPTAP